MYGNNSNFLQEVINRYYERGLRELKRGNVKEAQKLIYSAAENTLLLAKDRTGEARTRLIKRAEELCEFADTIESRSEENLRGSYDDDEQKQDMPRERDEDGAAQKFIPSSSNSLTLDDVMGLDDVKDEIRRLAVYPREYPELYEQFKKKRGGGILLYGVPGTGKTMIANAIANELGAAFYPIKCSDILSKWFGEAEQNIKALFEEAGKNPISVIFFDEFDALGTTRDTDSSNMKRIIPELLVGIQRAEESENTIVVIAATNRPWDIDSAFLRPGRFKLSIHVPLPDTKARRGMIDSIMSQVPMAEDLDIDKIVELSEGFSGADIAEMCERFKDHAIERIINEGTEKFITNSDVERVMEYTHSSVQDEDLRKIAKYKTQNSL